MKKLFSLNAMATMVLALGIMVAFDSCTEDPCENVTCVNGSTVTVGDLCTCECDNGFSGSDCTIEDLCITQNTTCLNGGTCLDGDCTCAAGYEGDSCSIVSRDKFLGVALDADEACGAFTAQYVIDIIAGTSGADIIRIKNLGNYNCPAGDYYVDATVSLDEVTIINDTVCAAVFSGSGSISSTGVLTLTYSATYTPQGSATITDNCSFTVTIP